MPAMTGKRSFGTDDAGDPAAVEVVPAEGRGRAWTVSLALPASILQNAQSPELRMYLAGQVARALAIYNVDEVVVFSEPAPPQVGRSARRVRPEDPAAVASFFATILRYVETPQYLRKHLFPMSGDLRLVGLLNPLALPSHLARDDYARWREGVAVDRRHGFASGRTGEEGPPTRFVDVGLDRLAEVDAPVPTGRRVTVDLKKSGDGYDACPGKYLYGALAERGAPARADGTYWGYTVREAGSLAGVFRDPAVCEAYDLVLGTSERGTRLGTGHGALPALPGFKHALIVFGGVQGLEFSASGDEELRRLGMGGEKEGEADGAVDVAELFDFYINSCPDQGSRTIRTEEAILITMAALKPFLNPLM